MTKPETSGSSHLQLLKLIRHVLGSQSSESTISSHYRSASQLLTSFSPEIPSELQMIEKIKKNLVRDGRAFKDSVKFSELSSKLNKSPIIKNRSALLLLFYSLYEKRELKNTLTFPNVLTFTQPPPSRQPLISSSSSKNNEHLSPNSKLNLPSFLDNSERNLIRELLFIFQGIEGKFLRRSSSSFIFSDSSLISSPVGSLAIRLSELGWLYSKVYHFTLVSEEEIKNHGLIRQSFILSLKNELGEYYRLLSILESFSDLNLFQLSVWTLEPFLRMKTLAALTDASSCAKGGFLISHIYNCLHHGNPLISETIKDILCTSVKPLYTMLLKWICDGILEDPFNEFFIASDSKIPSDRLWIEKYSIRRSMIPKFLSLHLVKKILATGKSINFLHEVCHESSTTLRSRSLIKESLDQTTAENLFDPNDNVLHSAIHSAYTETSNSVLSVLFTRYKFLEHVTAMRKYLLLGQGDIIRYLLELLQDELCKPASSLYPHNLAGILETAIRATNSQFEDPEILERLDVRLLEIQPGDSGWDVFSLDYKVDGPIKTVFSSKIMMQYLMLFNALWRAKRMEWILSYVWKRQALLHKMSKNIPECHALLHIADLLSSEMIHFIHQMAYYVTFEVMECSWDLLISSLHNSESLDEIIEAHDTFLFTLIKRSLLNEDSIELLTQLRAIYDRILEFQSIQNNLYVSLANEVETRSRVERTRRTRTMEGLYGTNAFEEKTYLRDRKDFVKSTLGSFKAQLKIVSQSYQDMVRSFLLQLTLNQDTSLQFLSFRLDFNQHYKRKDARLGTPLTFQHRRSSGKESLSSVASLV